MKVPQIFYTLLLMFGIVHALTLPASFNSISEVGRDLFKRKGGGGGKGGSSSSGSTSSSGSSGSSSSSGSSGSTGSSGSSSSSGSRTGTSPSYGSGGGYYGGGASSPYRAGSARGGVSPYALAGLVGVGIFSGVLLANALAYNYNSPWHYHNNTDNQDETRKALCYCNDGAPCGCDPTNNDSTYQNQIANNATVSRVADINGTSTLLVNGTLSADTTIDDDGTGAAGGSLVQRAAEISGWWVVLAGVGYTMWFM